MTGGSRQMNYTLKDVASANRQAGHAEYLSSWSTYLLYRRPGNVLAWLLLKTSVTPTQITVIALLVALALPLAALLLPLSIAAGTCFALAVLFQVLDCTDGSMARTNGSTSKAGGRYDFMVDIVQWGMLYAALGILADRTLDSGTLWTMIGFAAAWLRMLARIFNMIANRMNDDQDQQKDSPAAPATKVQILAGLSGLLPFLLLAGPGLHIAVGVVLLYSLGDVLDAARRLI